MQNQAHVSFSFWLLCNQINTCIHFMYLQNLRHNCQAQVKVQNPRAQAWVDPM